VLRKHLPAELAPPEGMAMDVRYQPDRALDAILTDRLARVMRSAPTEERAQIRRRIYEELALIEV
jgi:hypothetical protein